MVPASKRLTIHRASNVLTLSLKRFANFNGGKIGKVTEFKHCSVLRFHSTSQACEAGRTMLGTLVPRLGKEENDVIISFCLVKSKSFNIRHKFLTLSGAVFKVLCSAIEPCLRCK